MKKWFAFEIKDMTDQGCFTGMASVYGNVDLGDDVVEPGAFTKTIQDRGGQVPILWQHDPSEPIGIGTLKDSSQGLQIEGKLVMGSPTAAKAYELVKGGVIKGLSIGYDVIRKDMKDSVRYLKELKLWEVSLVTFPMNEMATVSAVKAADLEAKVSDLETQLKTLQALVAENAAKAPSLLHAAKHDEATPDSFHLASDRLLKLLTGDK